LVKSLTVDLGGDLVNVLVLVGSARSESYNGCLAEVAVATLGASAVVERFDRLAELPYYSPEADDDPVTAVIALRDAVDRADALVVVTPEYNASIPAVLKNAIDWASRPRGEASIAGKPVAILAATTSLGGAASARQHLHDILTRAHAEPLAATVGIADATNALVGGELVDPEVRAAVESLLAELTDAAAVAA
jgi:chromate reductase